MAEAVVTYAVERLGDLLISEAKFLNGVRGEIEEIQRELKRMQCFLREADKKQILDDRVRGWVVEVKELAFKTEDVIESFAMEVAAKEHNKSSFMERLRRFAYNQSEDASLQKFGREIETIRSNLSSLTSSLQAFGITRGLEGEDNLYSVDLRTRTIFYSPNNEKDFVGMEKEIEQLIMYLKNKDKGCEVVSICGMGGQGKTTVAFKLYNNAQVRAHFEAFAGVHLTQQFDAKNVLQNILIQLLPASRIGEVFSMCDEEIVYELHKVQQDKSCFILIDDIWTIGAWRNICSAFPIGVSKSGSKILLTTRNQKFAEIGSVYELPDLTEEESWQLLCRKAFPVTGDFPVQGVEPKMESIGRQMVLRCKGLPLAVSVLGGMLRSKPLREWELINRDISFYLARGESEVDKYHTVTHILELSYHNLPPRLRQCFLCLANYKEDEDIEVEQLYLFWIAEGLISVEDKAEGEMMLNVAERYLDELAHRSLVRLATWENEGMSWSRFEKCRLHDLIRELCLSKVKEEKVVRVIDLHYKPDHVSEATNNRIRRLCIHLYDHMDEDELTIDDNVIPQIRSLLLFNETNVEAERIFSFKKNKLLRVLTIKGFLLSGKSLGSTSKLMYLKYLSLKGCVVKELPSRIGDLGNLETLDLRVRNGNIRIANILWKFKQLKHLYLPKPSFGGFFEDQEKVRLDGMNELELINGFHSRYCEVRDLTGLMKIKVFEGSIIVDAENTMIVENIIDCIKSKELCYSSLEIEGEKIISTLVSLLECSFIDHLRIFGRIPLLPKQYDYTHFSPCLTSLMLMYCGFEEDPMMLLETLPNLRSLILSNNAYMGTEMVHSATGFPQLQSLFLISLPNLTNWRVHGGAMPNLSRLQISECEKLEMLPDGLRFLTALKQLFIKVMPTAFSDRVRVIDGVEGQDFYKVRHVPSLTIIQ